VYMYVRREFQPYSIIMSMDSDDHAVMKMSVYKISIFIGYICVCVTVIHFVFLDSV
jgi:hypothetical protein